MIEKLVRLALINAATPLAAGTKVYALRAPEGDPVPTQYTVISRVGASHLPTHDDPGGYRRQGIQVDHYFTGLEPARQVSEEGRRAVDILDGMSACHSGIEIQQCLFQGESMYWDGTSKTARLSQDFEIVYSYTS